ncbi:MAG: two-component regulator propeller domain-containing protein [Balneolaceae bacterium]
MGLVYIVLIGLQAAFCEALAQENSLLTTPFTSNSYNTDDYRNYVITQYSLEDGLPQSSVNDIIQTSDGYMWMATFGGLVRFDGNSFTTFNRANTPGMRSERVMSLFEQSNGTIWISTEDGLIKRENDQFTPYVLIVESQIFAPSVMDESTNGQFWLVARGQPFRYDQNRFVKVPITEDKTLADEAVANQNEIWLAFGKKVLRTLGNSVVLVYDFENELESNIIDFIEYPKNSGTYFLGTDGNGVARFSEGEFTHYNEEDGLSSRYIWGFDVDRSNRLWVTSYNGQTIWEEDKFAPFNAIKDYEDIQFTSIYEDPIGNYWIGTTAKGFFKVSQSIISTIDKDQGLKNEKMLSLTRLRDGTTLFATNCGGIYEWKNGKAIPSAINKFLPNQCVWSVYEDSKGYIWYGSKILYRSKALDEPGTMFGGFNGFDGFDIFAITEDSQGNVWIGCFNGVYVYDGKRFKRYTIEDGLAYNDSRVFFEDEDGKMWIGSSSGLSTIHNGIVQKVDMLRKDQIEVKHQEPYIRAIHKDEEGAMWLGSYGDGIYRLKDGNIVNITMNDGLFDNIVSHIAEDENGNLWMGSNRGISRINRHQVNEYLEGRNEEIISHSYGTVDGMNSAETNGGFQPNVFTDSLGKLFFPTISGVAVVSTRDISNSGVPPRIRVERLRTNVGTILLSDSLVLAYDTPFLEINYTAIAFTDPKKVQFRYKLTGLDDSWIEVGDRRTAMYSKIPPGEYTFQVTASNDDGIWNTKGASLAITVVPPFWQTNWFYAIVTLLILASGPSIYFMRVINLEKENVRQKRFTEQLIESQEQERRRIAAELHDGLGQQILVIKNRAELAQQLVNDPEGISSQLREIMQSAVISIGDVRSISHDLRPVHLEKFGLTEAITNLCDQLRDSSPIEWSYHIDDIDGAIPLEKEINFYRVLQEGTNNILKHANAKQASVMVRQSETGIKAVIWDDGHGFDLKKMPTFSGLGFLGMQERIKNLSGTLDVESEMTKGTVIKIYIPVAKHG